MCVCAKLKLSQKIDSCSGPPFDAAASLRRITAPQLILGHRPERGEGLTECAITMVGRIGLEMEACDGGRGNVC